MSTRFSQPISGSGISRDEYSVSCCARVWICSAATSVELTHVIGRKACVKPTFGENLEVDTISGGRLIVTIGLGYRPVEYELFGTPFEQRGRLVDELLETLTSLWSSATFTPAPLTRPHPTVFVGGSVRATAIRAARYGLPLNLPSHLPELAAYYRALCAERGHAAVVVMPPERN
jgi:Luciferase-like monooxygenase